MRIKIDNKEKGKRVDTFLSEILKDKGISRSILQKDIQNGCIVNDKPCKKGYRLKEGDVVDINEEYWEERKRELDLSDEIVPQKGKLNIRYEDENFLVLYKPKGLVMHPGVGNKKGTLANYVRYYLESKGEYDSLVGRAGIVHRLDKGVSGLVVVGKNKEAQEFLRREFKNRRVIKIYHALLEEYTNIEQKFDLKEYVEKMNIKMKPWKEWEKVEGYIGRSKTDRYKMEFKGYEFPGSKYALSYILFGGNEAIIKIETGRMHQIRATLNYLGYHIKGDSLYGRGSGDNIMLEAVLLSFLGMDGKRLVFTC